MHKNAVIVKVHALRCRVCEHVWMPRVPRPVRCPRCWAYVDAQSSDRQPLKSVPFGTELSLESGVYPTCRHPVSVELPGIEDLDVPEEGMDLEITLDRIEAKLLLRALRRAKGKRKQAAQLLGLSYCKLRYKIQKHGIKVKERDRSQNGLAAVGLP